MKGRGSDRGSRGRRGTSRPARGRRRRRRGVRRGEPARRRWPPSACGGSVPVAPVAVRVRRSLALSLRISPTVIARIASARKRACGGCDRDRRGEGSALSRCVSIARPASAASVAGGGDLLAGERPARLDEPAAGTCVQPWRRRPSRVTNEAGRPPSSPPEPRTSAAVDPLDVRDGELLPRSDVQKDELVGGHGLVGQEVRARIDRGGVDAEVPEQSRRGDVETRSQGPPAWARLASRDRRRREPARPRR